MTHDLREALKVAIGHIEHMAAWITATKIDTYSFESLGEDMPWLREALTTSAPKGEPGYAAGFEACRKAAKDIANYHAVGNGDQYDDADIGGCTTATAIHDAIAALSQPAAVESNASAEVLVAEADSDAAAAYLARRERSEPETLARAEAYEKCGNELNAILSSAGRDEATKSESGTFTNCASCDMPRTCLDHGRCFGPSDPPDRREIVAQELRRFHQNSCYPDASDVEVAIGVNRILAALDGGRDA